MLDPKKLEELAKQIAASVPPGVRSMAEGAEGRIKQVLQVQLAKLDLVTREEFDVQSQVLIRTREKLDAMEARLAELEEQAKATKTTPPL
ncbi:accessory factor UbiK family protein [Alteromonas pelagimontana]|uniref:Ubiquinone biosynthesis accessory factor UbiK n=1 Tax=Alteromonas pelagimontana TaxID=1858656 RepID=A0A6M4MD42_9ALTE|nr:accessory factor UbiK family protein [Alteromonas pelagimontana]QJR81043.1 accessory factor UbiK family protein [Alteromonas pelagimontana]